MEGLRAALGEAVAGTPSALEAADRLCVACVELLEVDGASVSLIHRGATRGTFGSSGALSRRLDELQFTFGEGPCLDAVSYGRPVLAADLRSPREQRWPAFTGALVGHGIQAVFALPVSVATHRIGALDLYREQAGALSDHALSGGLLAAELAALPLLDLMGSELDWAEAAEGGDGWQQLASLERVEVYQATGMIIAALGVDPVEALLLLRARAFATGTTASALAYDIVERTVRLEGQDWDPPSGTTS